MANFILHPQLANDTLKVGELPLCLVLLMNDKQFPWVILVPRVGDISEVHQLSQEQQLTLSSEVIGVGKALMDIYKGEKLNTAALGNMVPQLHIHQIVRYRNDIAWPHPIWGKQAAKPYSSDDSEQRIAEIRDQLSNLNLGFAPC